MTGREKFSLSAHENGWFCFLMKCELLLKMEVWGEGESPSHCQRLKMVEHLGEHVQSGRMTWSANRPGLLDLMDKNNKNINQNLESSFRRNEINTKFYSNIQSKPYNRCLSLIHIECNDSEGQDTNI